MSKSEIRLAMKPLSLLVRPLLACAMLSFCVPLLAQDEATDMSRVVGSWQWTRVGLSGDVTCTLRLQMKDGVLAGTFEDSEGFKAAVKEASLMDDEFKATLVPEEGGETVAMTLVGKVRRNEIAGKMNDGSEEVDWVARRAVLLDDVLGDWVMRFTIPDGQTVEPEFTLGKNNRGKPTLEFDVGQEESEEEEVSDVTFDNGRLGFTLELVWQGQDIRVDYELDLKGDELSGLMFVEVQGGDGGEIEVEGERIK